MTTSNLHLFKGGPVFSAFRIHQLTRDLASELPALPVESIEAVAVTIVETAAQFSSELWPRIAALLDTDCRIPASSPDGFFVTPRKGTLSPWASKATDIFHNCGLSDVQRVERGILFHVRLKTGRYASVAELQPVLHLVHDRMTEGVYSDLSDIFRHIPPAELVSVDILGGGLHAL